MSRPRAAMSVATRMATRPSLKSESAFTRWDWLRLPWMAAASMPSLRSCSASRFAPCFVRVKTRACLTRPRATSSRSRSRLRSRSTGMTSWSMSSVVVLRGVTWTCAGLVSRPSASWLMSSEKVAENSRFWRFGGSTARILRMSRMKPMSSMRSASSRTRTSTLDRLIVPWPRWSSRRPGVATTISGPARSLDTCGPKPTPP